MISDNRLQVFVALAESGSFTAAARRLGCSQPSVSQNIAQLEEATGQVLFERGKAVSLTPAGTRFYHYAKRILSLYERLDAEMNGQPLSPEKLSMELGDGKLAELEVRDGKLEISLISANN